MSACTYSERVAALASGEPDDELTAHLPGCATCRAELDDARRLLRGVGELVEPARLPGHAGDPGEPFWTDFTRGVRVQYDAQRSKRSRAWWAWLAAPALCTAAAALVLLTGGADAPRPHALLPVTVAVDDVHVDDVLGDADPEQRIEILDDDELDRVLARLEGEDDVQPGEDVDPEETLDTLDDDELERVFDALVPGKGA